MSSLGDMANEQNEQDRRWMAPKPKPSLRAHYREFYSLKVKGCGWLRWHGRVPGSLPLRVFKFQADHSCFFVKPPPSKVSKFLLNHRASSESEAEITAWSLLSESLYIQAFNEINVSLLKTISAKSTLPAFRGLNQASSDRLSTLKCSDLLLIIIRVTVDMPQSEHMCHNCFERRSDCLCSRLEREEATHWRALIFSFSEIKGRYCNLDVSLAT